MQMRGKRNFLLFLWLMMRLLRRRGMGGWLCWMWMLRGRRGENSKGEGEEGGRIARGEGEEEKKVEGDGEGGC